MEEELQQMLGGKETRRAARRHINKEEVGLGHMNHTTSYNEP
jgi:hypothetical protein